MKKVIGIFLSLLFLTLLAIGSQQSFGLDVAAFEGLAIQDGGRVKPFDTFARESVQLITGVQKYQRKNPTELVLSWLFLPQEWSKQRFFQIKHLQLKKELGIPDNQIFVAPMDFMKNEKLGKMFEDVAKMLRDKKKLDPYYTAVNHLRNQIQTYNEIISGSAIRLVPQKISQDWMSVAELQDDLKDSFTDVARGYFGAITRNQPELFDQAVANFKQKARDAAPKEYPTDRDLKIELDYNKYSPFQKAYIFYFLAAVLFLISLSGSVLGKRAASVQKYFYGAAIVAVGLGWLIHVWGFALRCWIAGRPPVSNMYESIIWVSLGCLTFGLIFEFIYKKKYFGLAASMMAGICLIVGDSVPAVLDQSIHPLEPVLRSNLWLTVHVLTITLSYAAFTLATGVGNIGLYIYARGEAAMQKPKLQELALYVYRSVQVGVLLLTAGTILGGVWADYSWGRFWGWDPKETWALIADLTYLAVLHGRFSGWLRTFGTIAAPVCCYSAVVMAWYGVNFVLGEGKHSYGFGNGGVQYVASAILVQLMFVGFAYLQYQKAAQKS